MSDSEPHTLEMETLSLDEMSFDAGSEIPTNSCDFARDPVLVEVFDTEREKNIFLIKYKHFESQMIIKSLYKSKRKNEWVAYLR